MSMTRALSLLAHTYLAFVLGGCAAWAAYVLHHPRLAPWFGIFAFILILVTAIRHLDSEARSCSNGDDTNK